MVNESLNRRPFIIALGCTGVLSVPFLARHADDSAILCNLNYQTAIGIGGEPASIVDRFSQFKSGDTDVPEPANACGSRRYPPLPLRYTNNLTGTNYRAGQCGGCRKAIRCERLPRLLTRQIPRPQCA